MTSAELRGSPGGCDTKLSAVALVLTPGSGLSLTANDEADVIHLKAYELPLLMWGRCPSRLRDPDANAETIEDVLRRLVSPDCARRVGYDDRPVAPPARET